MELHPYSFTLPLSYEIVQHLACNAKKKVWKQVSSL